MKKIMFNDKYGQTEAVLYWDKTSIRRLVPVPPWLEKTLLNITLTEKDKALLISLSKYKIGEEIAIAQAYKQIEDELPVPISNNIFEQKQAYHIYGDTAGWHNKMFVAANLMPHCIKITNIRIERLQDISDEDCFKEGIREEERDAIGKRVIRFGFDDARNPYGHWYNTPREAFAALIDKVLGKNTWNNNPYVFVYDFDLIK